MTLYEVTLEAEAQQGRLIERLLIHAADRKGGYVAARRKAEMRLNRQTATHPWRAVRTKQVG